MTDMAVSLGARVSAAGRQILTAAVSIDHDWSLRFSSEDKLIEAVKDLTSEDLEAAALLVHYLQEAIACNQIRLDGEERRRRAGA
jgi:hypothetical protein